jgi:hypothetical protein
MSLVTVIPGYQIADGEILTYAKLRAMAQPTVSLTTDLFNLLSSFKNGFINGNMQLWTRGTGAKSCAAGVKTWQADRWFVRSTGAAVTYAQSTSLPGGAIAAYSAKITGAASVTAVDFGQRIESVDAHSNWRRQRCFSAWVYNDTGTAFTPVLQISTPTAADNYASNAVELTQSLQACPSGGWTQVSFAFDGSTFANGDYGMEIVLQIPSGSLNSNGKAVYITQLQCEPGTVVTAQEPRSFVQEQFLSQRYCLGLVNQVLGFAGDATNLPNKGIFTLPTTMRVKPVFDGNNSATGDNTNDFFTDATAAVSGAGAGTPAISGYAGNIVMAVANGAANWTAGHQINITCVFTAEDRS